MGLSAAERALDREMDRRSRRLLVAWIASGEKRALEGRLLSRQDGPEARALWRRLDDLRDRAGKDQDPLLAEFFERFTSSPLATDWKSFKRQDAIVLARLRGEHPELAAAADRVWSSAQRDEEALWAEKKSRLGRLPRGHDGKVLERAIDEIFAHRAYQLWASRFRLDLRDVMGAEELAMRYGLLPQPWREGWPAMPRLAARPEASAPAFAPELVGIGATLVYDGEYAKVRSLFPSGPAQRSAALKPGDLIEAVAQGTGAFQNATRVGLERVTAMVRGPKGSLIRLRIIPAENPAARRIVALRREEIRAYDAADCDCLPPRSAVEPASNSPLSAGAKGGKRAAPRILVALLAAATLALFLPFLEKDRQAVGIALAAGLVLAGLHAADWTPLSRLDDKWLDRLFGWHGPGAADSRVVVVAIDEETFARYPTGAELELLVNDRIFIHGPLAVGYDVAFNESISPEADRLLVRSTCRWGPRLVHSTMAERGLKGNVEFKPLFLGLNRVARSVGLATKPLGSPDGGLRRTFIVMGRDLARPEHWANDPAAMPGLAAKLASVMEGRPVPDFLKGGNIRRINYRGGFRAISAARVIAGALSPDERAVLDGSVALVGYTTPGKGGSFETPFGAKTPDVMVEASVLDNLLNDRFLREAPWWLGPIATVGFAFLGALAIRLAPVLAPAAALVAAVAWAAASYGAFLKDVTVPFAAPVLALGIAFSALLIRKTHYEARQRRRIRATFGQFVAPEVVRKLAKSETTVEVGGEAREMTVFFLDIAGFTRLSEKLTAKELVVFLNRYLSAWSRRIHDRHGVIDKYIGDSIMAFWNAPMVQEDHAVQACLAALDCIETLEELNRGPTALPQRPRARIGLATGEMTVGLTGSELKLQYTVLGDTVNLASRLEDANKAFGSRILVNGACFEKVRGHVEGRPLGRLRVRGKEEAVSVWEILARKGELPKRWSPILSLHGQGLASFQKGDFSSAARVFEQVLRLFPADSVAAFFYHLCRKYRSAPPASWKGVVDLST